MTGIRLSKYLADSGVASRRKCEEFILSGKVSINGRIIKKPQEKVSPDDIVLLEGVPVKPEQKKVAYLLHKPKGLIASAKPYPGQKSVLDLFKSEPYRLFTVGRLDKDTTGMLIVTNDGELSQKIIHPSSDIPKEYVAKTNCEITAAHLKKISEGIYIEKILVKPEKVSKVRKGTVKIVVKEGKKREVRRLIENAKLRVLELKRTRIGDLSMGNLPYGMWRPLTEKDIRALLMQK